MAVLWVIAYHLLAFGGMHPWIAALPIIPGLLRVGWIGVMIFFVLSGYLITLHLTKSKGQWGYFSTFIGKRCARILPPYFLLLLALPVAASLWSVPRAAAVFSGAIPLWSHFLLLQNIPMAISGGLGNGWLRVSWSLAVEVQYYAFIVVLVWFVPSRRLGIALGLVALISVVLRYWALKSGLNQTASMVLTPCRMDSFALGGLVALAHQSSQSRVYLRSAVLAGLVGLLLFIAFAQGLFGRYMPVIAPLYYTFLAITCASAVAIGAAHPPLFKFLESRFLVNVGRTSYFLYLFHMPVALMSYEILRNGSPEGASSVGVGLAFLSFFLCWLLANVSWHTMELPIITYCNERLKTLLQKPRAPSSVKAFNDRI